MPGRVAFVPLRYGPQIVGGSEALTREIAIGLAARGWDVEVLTTRVIDHETMADELPEGASTEDGLTVRRFSTEHHRSRPGLRAQHLIQHGTIPPIDDQWSWVSWRFTTPDLFHHLLRYGESYDAVVFSPYIFWNTTACLGAVDGNAIVMPCLHDETYARLDVMRPVLADPASVWFLSEPEHQLAHRLGPVTARHQVTGAGIHVPQSYDPDGFRARHSIDRPFVLYAGRREHDKGWGWLLDTFASAVQSGIGDIDLVTFGAGAVEPPAAVADRVIDLGFVSETDKNDAFAAALAYVQPSRMESFSRTVMEAWLAGTPVLAVEGSEVVEWHIQRSGGGMTFRDGSGLATHIRDLRAGAEGRAAMGSRGREYVRREYDWPVVLDRIEADLARFRVTPPLLVVGSYPPVPVAGAAVTVREVRRAWAAGDEVRVVAPRLCAAHVAIPVTGPFAGRRLDYARRLYGARQVVLVVEPGYPLPQWGTGWSLARALRRFEHVRLVRTADVPTTTAGWHRLVEAADEVDEAEPGPSAPGVTPLGSPEVTLWTRVRARLAPVRRLLRRAPVS